MDIQAMFAVAYVSDLENSTSWYSDLIGRSPDDRPMDGLVQWRDLGGAGLQLVSNVEKSGTSAITIVTPTLSGARAALASLGIDLERDMQGDFGIIAQISDPDGNRITLAEPPNAAT